MLQGWNDLSWSSIYWSEGGTTLLGTIAEPSELSSGSSLVNPTVRRGKKNPLRAAGTIGGLQVYPIYPISTCGLTGIDLSSLCPLSARPRCHCHTWAATSQAFQQTRGPNSDNVGVFWSQGLGWRHSTPTPVPHTPPAPQGWGKHCPDWAH